MAKYAIAYKRMSVSICRSVCGEKPLPSIQGTITRNHKNCYVDSSIGQLEGDESAELETLLDGSTISPLPRLDHSCQWTRIAITLADTLL